MSWVDDVCYPMVYELGITKFYKLYLPWMRVYKFLTIKFEDLIGFAGGGDETKQKLVIANIARHLNIKPQKKLLNKVVKNLFGGTGTFRKGQIGSWRYEFTAEMKNAYKSVPGACQLLIDLGYEKDSNW